ncbi:hypothetical protein EON79_02335 [bacterium]|nr:MAG: hypothetical protein EON79_02335 [bacterium]
MKRTLTLSLSLIAAAASAQNLPLWWNGTTGTNDAADVTLATAIDASNFTYHLAKVMNGANMDIRLTKYNSLGGTVWAKTYDFSSTDVVKALDLDSVGNPVFVGSRFDAGTGTTRMLIAKASGVTGDLLWDRSFAPLSGGSTNIAYDVKLADDDTIVVAGGISDAAGEHPFVAKYPATAQFASWTKNYTGYIGRAKQVDIGGTNVFAGVDMTSPGNYLTLARMAVADGSGDFIRPLFSGGANYVGMTRILALSSDTVALAAWRGPNADGSVVTSGYFGPINLTTLAHSIRDFSAAAFTYDIAYDSGTGMLGFQVNYQNSTTYNYFGAVDIASSIYNPGLAVGLNGTPAGMASVGSNRFASLVVAGGTMNAYLIDAPSQSVLSTTFLGSIGANNLSTSGVPLSLPTLATMGRALTVGGGSSSGARAFALSYLDGPNDDKRTKEDVPVSFNVLRNDGGGSSKAAYIATQPAHGSVTVAENGDVVYTPVPNWSGTDTFTYYTVIDGALYATPTVSVEVVDVNDAPTAVSDEVGLITNPNGKYIYPLVNDSDIDSPTEGLKIVAVTQPSNGTARIMGDRKRVVIAPNAGATGPFSVTYTLSDDRGMKSTATITGTFGTP